MTPPLTRRTFLALALASPLLPAGPALAGYREFALGLLQSPPAGVVVRPDLEAYLGRLASAYRTANRRPALTVSDLAVAAARAQALEMLIGNYVGHQSSTGARFRDRFEAFAGKDIAAFGENTARDRSDGPVDKARARRLFQQWVDSRGHRNNLMKRDYLFVSTGAIQKGHHLYAVQMLWSLPVPQRSGFY